MFHKEGVISRVSFKAIPSTEQYEALLRLNYIGTTSCILVKREAAISAGLFDVRLPAIQDYDFYLRIVKEGNIKYSDEPLTLYRLSTALKISKSSKNALKAMDLILNKFNNSSKEYRVIKKNLLIANIKKSIKNKSLMLFFLR